MSDAGDAAEWDEQLLLAGGFCVLLCAAAEIGSVPGNNGGSHPAAASASLKKEAMLENYAE